MTLVVDMAATAYATLIVAATLDAEGWDRPVRAGINFGLMVTLTYLVLRTWGFL